MAVSDDLNRLATQDVVYLSRVILGGGNSTATEVFRGRLRQALNGNWLFNAFTGQNGVVGFDLGGATGNWSSDESPAGGIQVTIPHQILITPDVIERIMLTSVIPADFTE